VTTAGDSEENTSTLRGRVLDAYRRWGYLQANLDGLGRLEPAPHPEIAAFDSDGRAEIKTAVEQARRWYCGTLTVETAHIPDLERRRWLYEAMESDQRPFDRARVLELLIRATTFEELLQSQYIGNKRFSIEGLEGLIPLLAEMLEQAALHETTQAVLAMSHRGRLNVMAHVVGRPAVELFAGFEDVDPRSIMGAGDVKYHLGATGIFAAENGREVKIHLVSNPSHLEAVGPVAMGRVRAKQTRLGAVAGESDRDAADGGGDGARRQVVPIVMHGDAAFAGQGIAAETLNLADVHGFSVGGTVHVVVNNLLGFTTEPRALQSGRFASDVAKRLPIPIFHVNAEDPKAIARAAHMAIAFRYTFATDVVVDLIGYRRHGHSEVDDPTITQPALYRRIQEREPLWKGWAKELGQEAEAEERRKTIRGELAAAKDQAEGLQEIPVLRTMPPYWEPFKGGLWRSELEVETGIDAARIERLAEWLTQAPEGFHVHDKVAKLLEQRHQMGRGELPVDFGMAEALAMASLLEEGHPVRLSGQDSRRGTFSHRHAALIDTEDGHEHLPLAAIAREVRHAGDGADARTEGRHPPFFEIYDSILSEAAVLAYEYGFSRDFPEALVAWEAQFGDFANGAQVIFDQFVTAGEDKWGLLSGLVVLLPHGFEGQGPEHSSARMERFLQLAAEDAIQVAYPSTAAQYFHLLRRQALRRWRKPLIVMTPKGMLRHKLAASARQKLTKPRFECVLPDHEVEDAPDRVKRIVLCTGKLVHELRAERDKRGDEEIAVLALEQLYPFPDDELAAQLDRYSEARDIVWAQEEPANMGALFFVVPRIERIARGRHVRTVKRSASASPATGSARAHRMEQETLIRLAL
jgi:2-oxoglutarate dehydrogenase E1 component